jgi:trans-4-hydroxy-L-proline dehydratase
MKDRIEKLRKNSLDAINTLSAERALLLTEFYRSTESQSMPVPLRRALAFEYIMENKSIYIAKDELIVGERGPKPKAAPTYPEICLHSLEDLEVLHNRPKVSFRVDDETRQAYHDVIIPYWKGKTQRDRVFASMKADWLDAYQAGVFTEFQEQRAPGHTVAGNKLFAHGMQDLRNEISESLRMLDNNDPEIIGKKHQLEAMNIVAGAIITFAQRHADALKTLAAREKDENRLNELIEMIRICEHVPANAPRNFHEALQHYWFIHLGVITELNPWDSFNPGRLDQHLLPFYRKGLEDGSLDQEKAKEFLQAFWVKFNNHPSPPKMGVTALESNTYTDFTLINLGGVKADGSDAVNELSYLILDVIEEMRLLQPGSMVQISKKNPDRFVKRALMIAKTGFGQPSFFNTDAIVQQLLSQGKSLEDARNGGASGCVETGAFGTEAYTLSGYFNLNKVLEIALHNGFDPGTQKQISLQTVKAEDFISFEELYAAFEKQLKHFIDLKIEGNNRIEKLFADHMPVPFMSLLIDECIATGKDYNAGGARYNTSYIQGVGLGSITDNLASIKKWVFDSQYLNLNELLEALRSDYEGFDDLRYKLVYETPKWGNNDDEADRHAVKVFNSFHNVVNGRPSYRGGVFRINMLPTTSHVYFGSVNLFPDGWPPHPVQCGGCRNPGKCPQASSEQMQDFGFPHFNN